MKRFNKSYILSVCAALFVITGCLGNGVETTASKEVKHVDPIIPVIYFGTPSATAANNTDDTTIAVSVTDAVDASLLASDFEATTSGTASCTVGVTSVTSTTSTIHLTSCTGNGTFKVHVKASSVFSSTGTGNLVSDDTTAVTIDNTGPTISTFTPASDVVNAIPSTLVVTFNEPLTTGSMTQADFVRSGNCGTPPTVGAPVFSNGNKTATSTLTGGSCTDGQTLTYTVNGSGVTDVLGNTGSGSAARTFTFSDGPTPSFAAWNKTAVNSSASITDVVTWDGSGTHANVLTPTISSSSILLVTTGTATCSGITNSGAVTTTNGTVQLSGCTGNGTVAIKVKAGVLETVDSIPNVLSSASTTFRVDNAAPTLGALSPATSTVASYPTVTASFTDTSGADPMDVTGTIDASDIVISGSCSTPPTVNTITPNGAKTSIDITFTGGTCNDGETLIVSMNGNTMSDSAGNVGNASPQSVTYTFDTTGPAITSMTPASATVNSMPASIAVTFDQALTTGSMTQADFVQSGTCSTPPSVGAPVFSNGNKTATSTLTGGSCNDTETLIYTVNAAGVTDTLGNAGAGSMARTYTFDTTGPSVVVTGVNATNATVTATFDQPVADMMMGSFSISGCTVNPVAMNFTPNGSRDVFTIDLDDIGATCLTGETLTISVDATMLHDDYNNAGLNTDSDSFMIP